MCSKWLNSTWNWHEICMQGSNLAVVCNRKSCMLWTLFYSIFTPSTELFLQNVFVFELKFSTNEYTRNAVNWITRYGAVCIIPIDQYHLIKLTKNNDRTFCRTVCQCITMFTADTLTNGYVKRKNRLYHKKRNPTIVALWLVAFLLCEVRQKMWMSTNSKTIGTIYQYNEIIEYK